MIIVSDILESVGYECSLFDKIKFIVKKKISSFASVALNFYVGECLFTR